MKKILVYMLPVLLMAACQKIELPPPEDPGAAPVYSLSWSDENGNTFSAAAGVEGYRLVPETELNNDGIWVLSSRYEDTDCFSECDPSLEFRLFDLDIDTDGAIDPALLQAGTDFSYSGGTILTDPDTSYNGWLVELTGTTAGVGANLDYAWTIGTDSVFVLSGQTVSFSLFDPAPLQACLSHFDLAADCQTTQCQTLQLTNAGVLNPPVVAIGYSSPNGNGLTAVVEGGTPPYTFSWSTGETGAEINVNTPGDYSVTVMDANGVESSSSVLVGQQPGAPLCVAEFVQSITPDLEITPGDSISAPLFGTIELVYTVGQTVYRSLPDDPNGNTFFAVDAVTVVADQPARRELAVRFRARLEDESGETIILEGEGDIVLQLP